MMVRHWSRYLPNIKRSVLLQQSEAKTLRTMATVISCEGRQAGRDFTVNCHWLVSHVRRESVLLFFVILFICHAHLNAVYIQQQGICRRGVHYMTSVTCSRGAKAVS